MIKKILLVILSVVIAIQIPFIYRRYNIGKLAEKIAMLDSQRLARTDATFNEYKGIIHAHTSLGGHSTGGFDELIAAANTNGLDFVLMTEHYSGEYDTSALTLNGVYGRTLFVGGNEIDTADGDRFLMIPGSGDAAKLAKMPTAAVLEKLHAENRFVPITYPEKFKTWNSNFDGIEVFSLHTAASKMNKFTGIFDVLWSGYSYPTLTFAQYFRRPDDNLKRFDETASQRHISLFAGTDAHSNVGFHIFGDDAGHRWVNIKVDPYETVFSIVRTHILFEKSKPLTRENLIAAMQSGRYFIGFDTLGDTTGFSFSTTGPAEVKTMGDEAADLASLLLTVALPQHAHLVIFKNGEKFADQNDAVEFTFKPNGPGEYRVEAYLDTLGDPFDKMPWIISNPIYVK